MSFLGRLGLSKKILRPDRIVLGTAWLGPGSTITGTGQLHKSRGQENSDELIRTAIQNGIVEFDTAPFYGMGAAEEHLGRALRNASVQADANANNLRVSTKVGRILWDSLPDGKPALSGTPLSDRICRNDYSAQGTRTSLAHSLARLGLDRVDTLRIHDPNDNSNNNRHQVMFVDEVAEALAPGGMIEELRSLRERGEIQRIGLGMNTNQEAHHSVGSPQDVLRLLQLAPLGTFDSALLAGGWNLLCQTGWECMEMCRALQVEVYSAGIFASGFLADDRKTYAYRDDIPLYLRERKRQWLDLVQSHCLSLPAVAVAFAALPNAVTRIVLGVAAPEELLQCLAWIEESNGISESFWEEANEMGLWHVKEGMDIAEWGVTGGSWKLDRKINAGC